jgi:uncharacterized protein YbjT (DUF2867 family)
MRIALAGATGVIGQRLVPLLIGAGHEVLGLTRSPDRLADLEAAGAEGVIVDVYDRDDLIAAVTAFAPDLVMHQLTDLPDDAADLPSFAASNARIRSEGTRNLLAAAAAAGAPRFLAQSIAWTPAANAEVVERHEALVLESGGVVVRYGQFYGPGTYYPDAPPAEPRVHIDEAARRTVELLEAPSGVVVVND